MVFLEEPTSAGRFRLQLPSQALLHLFSQLMHCIYTNSYLLLKYSAVISSDSPLSSNATAIAVSLRAHSIHQPSAPDWPRKWPCCWISTAAWWTGLLTSDCSSSSLLTLPESAFAARFYLVVAVLVFADLGVTDLLRSKFLVANYKFAPSLSISTCPRNDTVLAPAPIGLLLYCLHTHYWCFPWTHWHLVGSQLI